MSAALGAGIALGGTMLTLNAEANRQEAQFREAAKTAQQDLRRIAYTEFRAATDGYATATQRSETCQFGSDQPARINVDCAPSQAEYQNARFLFQAKYNDRTLIASDDALVAIEALAEEMPPSQVGPSGPPIDGEVDEAVLQRAYADFLDVARCDTSPNPPEECGE